MNDRDLPIPKDATEVIHHKAYAGMSVRAVKKHTDTQVTLEDGSRYQRSNGSEIAFSFTYSRDRITNVTPKALAAVTAQGMHPASKAAYAAAAEALRAKQRHEMRELERLAEGHVSRVPDEVSAAIDRLNQYTAYIKSLMGEPEKDK